MSAGIGYCSSCVNSQCDKPRDDGHKEDCPKGLQWTDGQASTDYQCKKCNELFWVPGSLPGACEYCGSVGSVKKVVTQPREIKG